MGWRFVEVSVFSPRSSWIIISVVTHCVFLSISHQLNINIIIWRSSAHLLRRQPSQIGISDSYRSLPSPFGFDFLKPMWGLLSYLQEEKKSGRIICHAVPEKISMNGSSHFLQNAPITLTNDSDCHFSVCRTIGIERKQSMFAQEARVIQFVGSSVIRRTIEPWNPTLKEVGGYDRKTDIFLGEWRALVHWF